MYLFSFSQQNQKVPRGKLFIIGGGTRSVSLMKELIKTARLNPKDHIVILPMSGENPDTPFYYIQKDLQRVCDNTIANLNFTKVNIPDKLLLDSLQQAALIFITGGDQNRFMDLVLNTPVHTAIHAAYNSGATIAGTSAGAAVMSKQMITGKEYSGDTLGDGFFRKIRYGLVQLTEGLGLLTSAIIDQHFVARSRYNRLLSVLAEYPSYDCIGIDEGTAIIVSGKKVTVVGDGQVIKMRLPLKTKMTHPKNGMIRMHNIQLDLLTAGDRFLLK